MKAILFVFFIFPIFSHADTEIIYDPTFQTGFYVREPDGSVIKNLPGITEDVFQWRVSQWYSKASIGTQPTQVSPGLWRWANSYKQISVGTSSSSRPGLTLAINSVNEWNNVYRQSGEKWPHWLVGQTFHAPGTSTPVSPNLSEMSALELNMNAQLLYLNNIKDQSRGYDSSLHSVQFVLFFVVQNLNRNSAGYGSDMIWLGIPLFDDRSQFPTQRSAIDGGTSKLIYRIDGRDIYSRSLHSRQRVNINRVDLLPHVRAAMAEAQSRNLFSSYDLNDFKIGGMNMGWEVPGLAVATMNVGRISLRAVTSGGGSGGGQPPLEPPPASYEFNSDGDSEGWWLRRLTDVYNGPRNGRYLLRASESDPQLHSPNLDFAASSVSRIKVRMANSGNAASASFLKIYWSKGSGSDRVRYSESQSITVPVSNSGGWAEYTLDVGQHRNWDGNINRLRVDPIYYGSGKAVGIDYIRFEQ